MRERRGAAAPCDAKMLRAMLLKRGAPADIDAFIFYATLLFAAERHGSRRRHQPLMLR